MTIFVLEMKRVNVISGEMLIQGVHNNAHTYIAGLFDDTHEASAAGEAEVCWRAGKYTFIISEYELNDFEDEEEKFDWLAQCEPEEYRKLNFSYSTNWMGPISTQWYDDRNLPYTTRTEQDRHGHYFDYKEYSVSYSCGRIDIRGDTDSPWGDELSLAPMLSSDWSRFSDWLETVSTDSQLNLAELMTMYENDDNPPVRYYQGFLEL